jgi:hypothetical protein
MTNKKRGGCGCSGGMDTSTEMFKVKGGAAVRDVDFGGYAGMVDNAGGQLAAAGAAGTSGGRHKRAKHKKKSSKKKSSKKRSSKKRSSKKKKRSGGASDFKMAGTTTMNQSKPLLGFNSFGGNAHHADKIYAQHRDAAGHLTNHSKTDPFGMAGFDKQATTQAALVGGKRGRKKGSKRSVGIFSWLKSAASGSTKKGSTKKKSKKKRSKKRSKKSGWF